MTRGIPLKLKTMALAGNHGEVGAMRNLALRLGLPFRHDGLVNARLLQNGGGHHIHQLPPERVVELDLEDPERVRSFRRFAAEQDLAAGTERTGDRPLYDCGAGRALFTIDPYGTLHACGLVRRHGVDIRGGGFARPGGSGCRGFCPAAGAGPRPAAHAASGHCAGAAPAPASWKTVTPRHPWLFSAASLTFAPTPSAQGGPGTGGRILLHRRRMLMRLRVGGLTLTLATPRRSPALEPTAVERAFTADRGADIDIEVREGRVPDAKPGTSLFDSGGIWQVQAHGRRYCTRFARRASTVRSRAVS